MLILAEAETIINGPTTFDKTAIGIALILLGVLGKELLAAFGVFFWEKMLKQDPIGKKKTQSEMSSIDEIEAVAKMLAQQMVQPLVLQFEHLNGTLKRMQEDAHTQAVRTQGQEVAIATLVRSDLQMTKKVDSIADKQVEDGRTLATLEARTETNSRELGTLNKLVMDTGLGSRAGMRALHVSDRTPDDHDPRHGRRG